MAKKTKTIRVKEELHKMAKMEATDLDMSIGEWTEIVISFYANSPGCHNAALAAERQPRPRKAGK